MRTGHVSIPDPDALRRVFRHPVGIGVRSADDGRPLVLSREEERLLSARALDRRRLQFRLGRAAARAALAELGVSDLFVGRGSRGEPLWPRGVVGAISHTAGTGIAVAGWAQHYRGIGVDVELMGDRLTERVAALICSTAELEWASGGAGPGERGAEPALREHGPEEAVYLRRTLLFSAKESIFKALYPIEHVWLGYHDAELSWSAERGGFRARLLKHAGRDFPAGAELWVDCFFSRELVCTLVHV